MDVIDETGVPDTEVSEQFLKGMRDRMAMSFYKYGPVAKAYPHHVNAANYCMIEFMLLAHPKAFYKATDSSESPGRASRWTGKMTQAANADLHTEKA